MQHLLIRSLAMGVVLILVFLAIHRVLQDPRAYGETLGRISMNYERIGNWDEHLVGRTHDPFRPVSNDSLLRWDASIYVCIRDGMYSKDSDCKPEKQAAFFPLHPLVWRATGANAIGISLIYFLLFALGLGLLSWLIFDPGWPRLALLITFPTVIVYGIPYSESLFFLTGVLMAWGLLKKRYALYFIGAFLLATVRSASVIVLIAVVLAELLHSKGTFFMRSRGIVLRALPLILGYFSVIIFQRVRSGSWTAMMDARQFWDDGIRPIETIYDWSMEGFGLSTFTLAFVCLPALVYSLWIAGKWLLHRTTVPEDVRSQLLTLSAFYITGILLFTVLTSGGSMHSLHRYIISSPFFYTSLFILLSRSAKWHIGYLLAYLVLGVLALTWLLYIIPFGSDKWDFLFAGMYLSVLSAASIILDPRINRLVMLAATLFLVVLNLIWATYLMNCFVVDSWIFL